jgi:flagellar hook protein FlgE
MLQAIQQALYGLQVYRRQFERTAQNIARWGTTGWPDPTSAEQAAAETTASDLQGQLQMSRPPLPDPARDIVDLILARHGYTANLQTLKTADEMLGTLLDTLA